MLPHLRDVLQTQKHSIAFIKKIFFCLDLSEAVPETESMLFQIGENIYLLNRDP